jgi:uncharacterized protein (DUF2062 family)
LNGFLQRKIITPVGDLLRQGVTPEKIAAAVAIGVVLGVFPVLGSTTLLCTVAATLLRLNLPLIQAVNFVIYPLQLILLIPMLQLGQRTFGAPPLAISLAGVLAMARASVWNTVATLGAATGRAVVIWLCLSWIAAFGIYFLVLAPLKWAKTKRGTIPPVSIG